ncbi:uncharacterized protein LOC117116953 [Anneissia japonica]|uniref:uncharacterized protein LOC117116953 n=1 Tax=Anneissia japonica TaxID=1529436 RepID=UPI00142591AB|nr:uncharacterized protein LOC117116953 [Anneissia japonica]
MSTCAVKNQLLEKGCDARNKGNYQLIAIPEKVAEPAPLCNVVSEKYLSELKEIIDKNSEDHLTKTCKSDIDDAFKNVHDQEGCNNKDHLALTINTLVETIVECTHYFPEVEKKKIQEVFINMKIQKERYKTMLKPVSSENTTKPKTQTVNVSSNLVVVESHKGQDLHISATDCYIIINCNDIKVNMLDSEPWKNDVNELFNKKRGTVRRKSIGSIKLLVTFQSKEALEKFQDEYKKGITEKEIHEILLKHKLIEQESRIDVIINTAWINISLEEFETIDKEIIDLVPFMVAAYNCENMEQLDSNLASILEKRITYLQSRFYLTQHTACG